VHYLIYFTIIKIIDAMVLFTDWFEVFKSIVTINHFPE
jgi:hypothetical protein